MNLKQWKPNGKRNFLFYNASFVDVNKYFKKVTLIRGFEIVKGLNHSYWPAKKSTFILKTNARSFDSLGIAI